MSGVLGTDQPTLFAPARAGAPSYSDYPQLRFMGSKYRLLPWIEEVLGSLQFNTVLDAFSGSGCVSYMLKVIGKSVWANDFLRFPCDLTRAAVENSSETLEPGEVELLLSEPPTRSSFIEETFKGIFFGDEDNRFLDGVWGHLPSLTEPKRALALAALYRSCLKRQPRGVFTVSGIGRYDDGRRDLRLPLAEHFVESVEIFNRLVFDNGREHCVTHSDVFELEGCRVDLAYLDPPYVPRADDNCYIKRYHFLEGLSSYWRGVELHPTSRVRKLKKRFTPFSYRKTAAAAFDSLFQRFSESILVLSYSSNGYPDVGDIVALMRRHKSSVRVYEQSHRYHFGTHSRVAPARAAVTEYLIVGQ